MKLTDILLLLILLCLMFIVVILYRDRNDAKMFSEKFLSGEVTQRAFERTLSAIEPKPITLPPHDENQKIEPKLTFVFNQKGELYVDSQRVDLESIPQTLKDKGVHCDDLVRIEYCDMDDPGSHIPPVLAAMRKFGIHNFEMTQKQ